MYEWSDFRQFEWYRGVCILQLRLKDIETKLILFRLTRQNVFQKGEKTL